eukprot:GDKH01020028.1.p1 GENE.GDKH01020028.1~~GDKH01020028.1.p1  ORF type:complete len:319 (+),score=41.75 GDKH01020028.1:124-1080(+)
MLPTISRRAILSDVRFIRTIPARSSLKVDAPFFQKDGHSHVPRCHFATASEQAHLRPTTVDPSEIAHFNKLASQWWDTDGPFAGLHDFNTVRVPFIQEVANPALSRTRGVVFRPLEGKRVLDVGCGGGILSEALARQGAQVTGIDASEETVKTAEARRQSHSDALASRLEFHCCELSDLVRERPAGFDVVVASEVIEHVEQPDHFFQDLVACTKQGGSLVITTLNKTPESYMLGIVVAENLLGVVPKGTHQWEKFVPPRHLRDLGKLANLHHVSTKGVGYIPGLRKWFPEPMCRINYMMGFHKKAAHGGSTPTAADGA